LAARGGSVEKVAFVRTVEETALERREGARGRRGHSRDEAALIR
jgi:hypothetical protein